MTYNELNAFFLNYLENDITNRAVMLTGEWGSGKSYYVKNTLKPFLESKDGNNHKCAIVSLYGLSDVSEISKAIFMELHTIKNDIESETGTTARVVGKIVAKTLVNGLIGKLGFEIGNVSDEDIQKVYNSIDLSNKLIVLEDIERTQIDIIELFGYINNMCENDGVKILLVTNEEELLTTYEETDDQGKKTKYYTDSAILYKRTKEKTIGDTVQFMCDYKSAIQQIIGSFGASLQKYNNQEYAEDIWGIFVLKNSYNLRAFIYACQKCKNIFDFLEEEGINITYEFEKIIFYGIIAFAQRQSRGAELHFKSDTYISGELGVNNEFPLFHFCYDYLINQKLSKEEIVNTIVLYVEYRQNSEWNSGRDQDIKILKEFYIRTDVEIQKSVLNLPPKLKNGSIPFCDFGVLLNYLVAIKYDAKIDINIQPIEDIIINGLKNSNGKITFERLFNSGYTLYEDDAIKAFDSIKKKILKTMEESDNTTFTYVPASLNEFYKKNIDTLKENLYKKGFACRLDITRFVEMLKLSSSKQISTIRELFVNLYRNKNHTLILDDDKAALIEMHKKGTVLLEYEKYDKIQKMQVKWFVQNLESIIEGFSALDDSEISDYPGEWINDR